MGTMTTDEINAGLFDEVKRLKADLATLRQENEKLKAKFPTPQSWMAPGSYIAISKAELEALSASHRELYEALKVWVPINSDGTQTGDSLLDRSIKALYNAKKNFGY